MRDSLFFVTGRKRYLILCTGDEINSSFARIFSRIFSWNLFHSTGRVVGWNKEVVLCLPLSSFCSFSRVLVFLTRLSPFLFDLLRSQRDSRASSVSLLHALPNLLFHGILPHGVSILFFIFISLLSVMIKEVLLGTSAHFASRRRDSEYLISLLDIHR